MSTLLKRMLTNSATGESPLAEGDSEGDNAKLSIRYEHGDANSVSLKFCSREELRIRSSGGVVPDGYDAHASKEPVVCRDWLMNADAKKALKGVRRGRQARAEGRQRHRARHRRCDDRPAVCGDLERLGGPRALSGDRLCVGQVHDGQNEPRPLVTLDAKRPAAGGKLTLRQLDDVVNMFVFLWRDAAGALQREQV
jgi:hypothetical protein